MWLHASRIDWHDSLYYQSQSERTDNGLESAWGNILIDFFFNLLVTLCNTVFPLFLRIFIRGTFFPHSTIVQPITVSKTQHSPLACSSFILLYHLYTEKVGRPRLHRWFSGYNWTINHHNLYCWIIVFDRSEDVE